MGSSSNSQRAHITMALAAGELPPQPQLPANFHWLLRLPPAFWARMYLYLDYAEIINLARLSSQFRLVRVENYLSWNVHHAILAHYDVSAKVSTARQSHACYLCFRMKEVGEFQRSDDTCSVARVVAREPYTGRRMFQVVPSLSPGQSSAVVQPPPTPASPPNMVLREFGGSGGGGGNSATSSRAGAGTSGVGGGGGVMSRRDMGMSMGMGMNMNTVMNMSMGMGSGSSAVHQAAMPAGMGYHSLGGQAVQGMTSSLAALPAPHSGPGPLHGMRTGRMYDRNQLLVAVTAARMRTRYIPKAPGADVGQIESLRRYCIDCAIQTGLSVPGDAIATRDARRLWVCRCPAARNRETNMSCHICGMTPVYRD